MTPTPDTTPAAVEAMCERLERTHSVPFVYDGYCAPTRASSVAAHLVYVNPDGPEAAAMLREVARERDEAMCCEGCGTTKSIAQIKATHPTALSCCPERKMLTAAQWRARALAAEAEARTLREALREIEALEIDWRLSTAENMRAASDLARAALKETSDGL